MSAEAAGNDIWTVVQAEARLGELIDKARHHGPQAITRNGKSAVMVVDAAQWERLEKRERRGSFADFLQASPLRDAELSRSPGGIREIDP